MALNVPQSPPSALLGTTGGTTDPSGSLSGVPLLITSLTLGTSPGTLPPVLAEPPLGEDDEDKDLEAPAGTAPKAGGQVSVPSDTDITAEFLQPLLTPENVANLVRGWRGAELGGSGARHIGRARSSRPLHGRMCSSQPKCQPVRSPCPTRGRARPPGGHQLPGDTQSGGTAVPTPS